MRGAHSRRNRIHRIRISQGVIIMSSPLNAPLDWKDIRASAEKFVLRFKKVAKESSYKQQFWIEFMQMFGVDNMQVGAFEYYVKKLGNHAGEIDYFWPGKMIIEHKSAGKSLDDAVDQAMGYFLAIEKKEERPRYIVVSDFKTFRILDLVERSDDTFKLEELPDNVDKFGFLAGYSDKRIEGQHPVNIRAAELMGGLYDLLVESNYPSEDVDLLLVRLVFCMFAEDADIFDKNLFHEYLTFHSNDDGSGMGGALSEIFSVLNTPYDRRQGAMPSDLQNFPYVNGGLFSKTIAAPMFNRDMRDKFFKALALDWKYISPAIFGSLFQSIMDPSMRRELGAHYTSEENILKLINPLFMDGLRSEYESIGKNKKELRRFRDKLAGIRVFDPACGCGNFLIISYREMRRLEMDVFDSIYGTQTVLDESHLHIDRYYGIEIGEFATMIANLSMILMDHLMNMEMRRRFGITREIIPLREKANIICANSLTTEWESVVDPSELTYIVGNPPFVGSKLQSREQRMEMSPFFPKNAGIMDYVAAWYVKAADFMEKNRSIRTAFVSTNSITQGEQVEPLWKPLFDRGIAIDFAYRTFKWNNEARGNAAVHVIIVGFGFCKRECVLFHHEGESVIGTKARSINGYLVDGAAVFLPNRSKPICDVPLMEIGNQPIDDGNYLFTEEEKYEFLAKEPAAEKYMRPWIGSKEFINGYRRYCLWLGDCDPGELRDMPESLKRVEAVRKFRLSSKRAQTVKVADTPRRFFLENMPQSTFIVVPETSSENREYVPIGFMTPDVLCSNAVRMLPNANPYHFGILTSKMHMVWMRHVCGRLKSDYRYSIGIVYNNFPWPEPSDKQKEKIVDCANEVLSVREKHGDSTFAELYDPLTMPDDLLKAHQKLDREVERAYRSAPFKDDSERISHLFQKYGEISSGLRPRCHPND